MTNFSRSSALNLFAPALALALLAGCGSSDGLEELAEGRAAFVAGDYARAEKMLRKSESRAPDNVDTLVELARLANQRGEVDQAKEWIARAEALAAGDVDVRLLGAQIAWFARDLEKAERLYRELATDESLSAAIRSQAWSGLGVVQAGGELPELARISYMRAIRLDSRNAAARFNLGYLYSSPAFGYPDAALQEFDSFVHLSPVADRRVQETQRELIPSLKNVKAQAAAKRGAKRSETARDEALKRAGAARKKGNLKAARAAYQEALAADRLSFDTAVALARLELQMDSSAAGQKRALDAYQEACAVKPMSIGTLLEAAALAEKAGRPLQARECYSRALAANMASLDAIDGLIRVMRKANADQRKKKEDSPEVKAYLAYRASLPAPKKK